MIVEQKFDDCKNHGLHHAWKIFEMRSYSDIGCSVSGLHISGQYEHPIPEDPISFLRKRTSHTRKCQNCKRAKLFEIEEVGKWVRK